VVFVGCRGKRKDITREGGQYLGNEVARNPIHRAFIDRECGQKTATGGEKKPEKGFVGFKGG